MGSVPSDWLVPLVYTKLDNSAANTADAYGRTILLGQKTAAGDAPGGTIDPIVSYADAVRLYGAGSPLAEMARMFFLNGGSKVYGAPLDDPSSGTAATIDVQVTAAATAAGTLALYIGGRRVAVPVTATDGASTIAAAIAASVNADPELLVTASVSTDTVTLTAKVPGTVGNQIVVATNLNAQDATPAGLTLAVTYTAGSGDTDGSWAIAAAGSDPYDFWFLQEALSGTLAGIGQALDDTTGRWSPTVGLYGHAFAVDEGSVAALTAAQTYNDQHLSVFGVPSGGPSPALAFAGAIAGHVSREVPADPARPLTGLVLAGVWQPASEFSQAERAALLSAGVATLRWSKRGAVAIERVVTTYTTDAQGLPDNSYQDLQVLMISVALFRAWVAAILANFDRAKLVDDGVRLLPGQAVATPKLIKGVITAVYDDFAARALVEHPDAFREGVTVQRSSTDPNRVEVFTTPDLANQLRIVGITSQFTR